ncbi:glutaredoxin 3 [Blochmannia endosymbiont of Colobopsis nipponica]|uniref:glutaredoxin 3 n=1 Tax=Blochmannia endosymbiont of Colobopsis nipponica TaxID=2681987 RepID=UPI001785B1E3|nr:glutaredoxin 3 [Blochmannia endosymbiont of Colobopsis nipponica]QOI10868.1 glutaredoxin 3 [Blochmannia endosymbiont of Colobopsis nipponica]
MVDIEIYTKEFCPFCNRAKEFLISQGLEFKEIFIDNDEIYASMFNRCGRKTVPQIFFNKKHIGGWDDLYELFTLNKLEPYLK